jgi:DHA1 family tetracycline resistance protein-like MFS transporter
MSKMVGDDQQGELQGILTSIYALAMIVSPLMMTSVFAAFTHDGAALYLPGAPFLVSILLILIGLAVFVRNPPPQG